MRHLYSVVRFLPNPARGESVNIGVFVATEHGACQYRLLSNMRRASSIDEERILPKFMKYLRGLGQRCKEDERGVEVLNDLCERSEHVLQFTRPAPVKAATIEQALDLVASEFLVDDGSQANVSPMRSS